MNKPIKIVKVNKGYHVLVNGVPLVKDGDKISVDRERAGLGTASGYRPPVATEPHLFPRPKDAISMAFTVGNYVMGLGSFTSGYTELVNVPGKPENWWSRNG